MVRPAAFLASFILALALWAAPAIGAEEAVPGGPPACSALASHPYGQGARPWRVDLWVQCNYEVSSVRVTTRNRKLKWVSDSPELVGARSTDAMQCRLGGSGAVSCNGRLKALARAHIRLNVNEAFCNAPIMRLSVYTWGGPTCEPGQLCPEVGFSNWTPSSTFGHAMGCVGS
jgi:hypothetical protein